MNVLPQALLAFLLISLVACGRTDQSNQNAEIELISYPLALDPNCGNGRAKIYDECANQVTLLQTARARAAEEGKTVLVSYGAEWCIWCHVFDQYIKGGADTFTYTYGELGTPQKWTDTIYERNPEIGSARARQLKQYAAERFVLVHINYELTEDGDKALIATGADIHYPGWIPYIFALDANGQYVGQVAHEDVEVRRNTQDWYRGYDRAKLMAILQDLDAKAQGQP